jgi:hypothetical protein
MNPKSGKAGGLVSPAPPKAPYEADTADPGEVAQAKAAEREAGAGKYAPVKAAPFKPGEPEDPAKGQQRVWVEIRLKTRRGQPVAGEPYEITVPEGTVSPGTLDHKGFARLEGMTPGTCLVRFPRLDARAWRKA